MPNATMFYREIAPSSEISHLVLSFWEFLVQGENCEPVIHEVVPDGCISLLYWRNKNAGIHKFFITDLSLDIFKTPVNTGDICWGMRFLPSACAIILRCNPAGIQVQSINDLVQFQHLTDGLSEKFSACQIFEEAVKIYEAKINSFGIKHADTDRKVAEAVKIIKETGGEVRISEIAEAVRLSTRQLERRFKKSAGLSPKQFARARRIRATTINMLEESEMNWANRAAAFGFSDQAHLTHEFSTLTGRSPNSFAKTVKRIEHGELVK